MLDSVTSRILEDLRALKRRALRRQIGTVTATSPLTVRVGGVDGEEIAGLSHLASYTPTINDVVWMTRSGRELFVHGEITTP